MSRWLRRSLLIVLLLPLLAVAILGALVTSETGSAWLLRQALTLAPAEVSVAQIQGRLSDRLQLRAVDYRQDHTRVRAAEVQLHWRPAALARGRLRIMQLEVTGLRIDSAAAQDPQAPFSLPQRIPVPLTLVLEDLRIDGLQWQRDGENPTHVDTLALSARVTPRGLTLSRFSLAQQQTRVRLSGQAALSQPYPFNAEIAWQSRLDATPLNGHGRLSGDATRIHLDHTLSAPAQLRTAGDVVLADGEPRLALHGSWQDLQWPLDGEATYRSSAGEYRVDGTPGAYRLALDGLLEGDQIPAARLQASARGTGEALQVESLRLATLGGRIDADGQLAWAPRLHLDLNLRARQIEPGRQWPLGDGRVDLDTRLVLDAERESLRVQLSRLNLRGQLRSQPLSAKGSLGLVDGVPMTRGLTVTAGENRLALAGALNRAGLDFDLSAPDPGVVLPGLTGKIQARGKLTGPLSQVGAQLSASASALAYGPYRVGRLRLEAALPPATEPVGQLDLNAEEIELDGRAFERLSLRLDGSRADQRAQLHLAGQNVELQLDAQGSYGHNAWQGRLSTANLEHSELGRWQLSEPVSLRLAPGEIAPFAGCWISADRRICLQGRWHDSVAQLQLKGNAAQGYASGVLKVHDLGGSDSRLEGNLQANIPDIRFLNALLTGARIQGGRVSARVRLAGSVQQPLIDGEAELVDGQAAIAELGLALSPVALHARMQATRVTLTGAVRSGKGSVKLDGELDLDAARDWPFALRLQGENFALSRLPDMEIDANPQLRLRGSARGAQIDGRVVIPHARIRLKELPPNVVKVSSDQILVGPAARQEGLAANGYPVSVNVVAILGDDVHFEGLGLSTELAGSLNVRSLKSDTLIGNGVLELRHGRYEGYGQKLSIERGRLLFAGPLDNPALDVRAVRKVNSVVAGIELYGTAEAPQTRLFSDPAMSDAEIMAYLVTGKPLGASRSNSDTQALAAAAASLGANSPLGQELSQLLGIEVGVQSGVTEEETALVVSKQLSSRLSIDYVYGMFNESAAIQFIYKLTEHLNLTGQSGAVQSIDLEYTINRP